MRLTMLVTGAVAALVLGAVIFGCGAEVEPSSPWAITDLGPANSVSGINQRGQVIGDAPGGDFIRAFVWQDGKLTVLPSLDEVSVAAAANDHGLIVGNSHPNLNYPDSQAVGWRNGEISTLRTLGGTHSSASAVNERDQIVGDSSVGGSGITGDVRAVLWQKGDVIDLGVSPVRVSTPDGDAWGGPTDINEHGQVVGSVPDVRIRSDEDYDYFERAFLWQRGKVTMLSSAEQGSGRRLCDGVAVAINDGGQIVGRCNGHAFLWQDGTMTDLGTLPGRRASSATAINERGRVVGTSQNGYETMHAFLWQNGTMTDLGTLGGASSEAVAVNVVDQVVGSAAIEATTEDGYPILHAFVWQDGKMTDLGTLPGGTSSSAVSVNDKGQIVGMSDTEAGERHAVLWTLRSG